MLLIALLLASKDVWSLARKAAQVLCDVVSACVGCICLSLNHLLLIFLPFGVEDADFEMLPPLTFLDYQLAVWALLRAFRLLSLFLVCRGIRCLTDVVLHDLYVRIESGAFWQIIGRLWRCCLRLLCFLLIVVSSFQGSSNLVRVWHTFELFILLHVLLDLLGQENRPLRLLLCLVCSRRILLLCHFLVIVELDLLDDNKIEPVDILSHLTILAHHLSAWVVLGPLELRQPLLLLHVHLSMLASFEALCDALVRLLLGETLKLLQRLRPRLHDPNV